MEVKGFKQKCGLDSHIKWSVWSLKFAALQLVTNTRGLVICSGEARLVNRLTVNMLQKNIIVLDCQNSSSSSVLDELFTALQHGQWFDPQHVLDFHWGWLMARVVRQKRGCGHHTSRAATLYSLFFVVPKNTEAKQRLLNCSQYLDTHWVIPSKEGVLKFHLKN